MPQSKHRKRKRTSNRSPIERHKRSGKELVPPFIQIFGEKLQLTSWIDDRLPEMLWAALIFASTERRQAFNEFNRILNFVAKHERKTELGNLTISRIAELEGELRREVISFITTNPRTSLALSALMLFDSLPGREDWEAYLSGPQPSSLHLLMTAVGNTLFHQSPGATDCRWVWTMGLAATGQISVNKDLSDYVERMTNYPNLEPGAPEGATIRTSEIQLASMMNPDSKWAKRFWQEAWDNSPCFQLATPRHTDEVQPSTTRQGISELIKNLEEHWGLTNSTTAVDAKHDAMFGMTFYVLRILNEMMAFGISNGILSRLGLRTILEVRTNLKYLIDKNDGELWQKWRQYGSGQAKLSSLKLDDLEEPPQYVDKEGIQLIASEDLWEELLTIDIGNWASGNLREISQEAQLKDTYDQYYPWTSAYAHGMWGAIRESSFQICGNPLHRLHRYPERQPLQDCLHDAVSLVDEMIEHTDDEYPSFPHRLLPST